MSSTEAVTFVPRSMVVGILVLVCCSRLFSQLSPDKPELIVQAGHSDEVFSLEVSTDGRTLYSASRDGTIKLWDLDSGQLLKTIQSSSGELTSVSVTLDGKFIAYGGTDVEKDIRYVTVFNRSDGSEIRFRYPILRGDDECLESDDKSRADQLKREAAQTPQVVQPGKDTELQVGKITVCTFILERGIHAVAFSRDGHFIASGDSSSQIKIWDVNRKIEVHSFVAKGGTINKLEFSSDGRSLITSQGGRIKLWDLSNPGLPGIREDNSFALLFANRNKLIVGVDGNSEQGTLGTWDSRHVLKDDSRHLEVPDARSYSLSHSEEWVAAAGYDRKVHMLNTRTGKRSEFAVDYELSSITFNHDDTLVVAGDTDGYIHFWDWASGREARTLAGLTAGISKMAFSERTAMLAFTSGKTIKVWSLKEGRQLYSIDIGMPLDSILFGPDGTWLAYTTSYDVNGVNNFLGMWDLQNNKEICKCVYDKAGLFNLEMSHNGRYFAYTYEPKGIRIWDKQTKKVSNLDDDAFLSSISSDDKLIVTDPNGLTFHNLPSGSEFEYELPRGHPTEIRDADELEANCDRKEWIKFSPVGDVLACGGGTDDEPMIAILDLKLGGASMVNFYGRVAAFAHDGRFLAVAGLKDQVAMIEVATGRIVSTFVSPYGPIHALVFGNDGKWLFGATTSGTIAVWECDTRRHLISLVTTKRDPDWLGITPEGLFDGSQGGQRLVSWRFGSEVYSADHFFADYYAPNLLGRIYSGEHLSPDVSVKPVDLPPELKIVSPEGGKYDHEQVTIKIQARTREGQVAHVRLYQNGKLVAEKPGQEVSDAYEFSASVIPGINIFEAVAVSRKQVESKRIALRLIRQSAAAKKPVLHLLVIGIDVYEDTSLNLTYASEDAKSILEFFQSHSSKLFQFVNSIPLYDQDANKQKIEEAFERLRQEAQPEDVLMVYFAGHGAGSDQQYYFFTHNFREGSDSEDALQEYGLTASFVGEAMQRVPALKQVLIIDACESGTALPVLAKSLMFRKGSNDQRAAQVLARANGIILIAASTKKQYAIEIPQLGHGVLTYAILNALGEKHKPAAVTTDGAVTALSVLQYVNQNVPELTRQYHDGQKQYPVSYTTGMDFPLTAP